MSEIAERVERAIFDAMDISDGLDGTAAKKYARAAIEAMREPTGDMLGAATGVFSHFSDDGEQNIDFTVRQAENLWPAMIAAALDE